MTEGSLTAFDVSERIRAQLRAEGVQWQASNADGFVLGDPSIVVKGVAVTFEPTLIVLKEAATRGSNLVISHEAATWYGFDSLNLMADDPVTRAKADFVRDNGMAVWRIHDHLHRMHPEPVFGELMERLGFAAHLRPESGFAHIEIPETTLGDLAQWIQLRLETANVSVVGERDMPVRSVGIGAHTLPTALPALRASDVVILGEAAEFDTFEYVRDANALGIRKGLIRISHERLEEFGVGAFADWLRPHLPEAPVAWLPNGDLFTVPAVPAVPSVPAVPAVPARTQVR